MSTGATEKSLHSYAFSLHTHTYVRMLVTRFIKHKLDQPIGKYRHGMCWMGTALQCVAGCVRRFRWQTPQIVMCPPEHTSGTCQREDSTTATTTHFLS